MSPRREKALALIKGEVKEGVDIRSNRDAELFTRLTGKKHEDLVASWKGGSIETSCNGFVGWYAGAMGITGIASWFKLESSLRDIGKPHAWVRSGSVDPQPGDILHHTQGGTGLHVDVCIGFVGRRLKRAAAGQTLFTKPRKPDEEFDVLKIVTGNADYNAANLLGWLDLDRFFDAAPAAAATTGWVNGWWNVNDGTQYYYYFSPDGHVQYTERRPSSLFAPPKVAMNSGTYRYRSNNDVFIEWNPADGGSTEETFTPDGARQTMRGTSNRYGALKARRM